MKIDEVKKSYFLVYLRAINISCIFTHLTFLIYGEIKGMHFSSVLILDDIFEPLCTLVRNLPLLCFALLNLEIFVHKKTPSLLKFF